MTVEDADAWIKQNIEWLSQPMHNEFMANDINNDALSTLKNEEYMPLTKKRNFK